MSNEVQHLSDELLKAGAYVVSKRAPYTKEIIGVAFTLGGARDLVLDSGDLEMLVPIGNDEYESVHVGRANMGEAAQHFRWQDESTIGGTYPGRFTMGDGEMNAYFQDQSTGFYVEWVELTR